MLGRGTLFLFALAVFLLARPYEGVVHDGVLYFGQVLKHGHWVDLAHDPFFAGGSQDAFSFYSPLMAVLCRSWGPALAHQAVVMAGLLGSALALLALLRRLGTGAAAVWGLMSVAALSSIYGGLNIFRVTEPFATARTLAEPLVLWSLVGFLATRYSLALGLLGMAFLLHPLMALPAAAVMVLWAIGRDRRWLLLMAGVPVALVLAAWGVEPWDRLLKVYDPYWWALVSGLNVQVVPSNWTLADWCKVFTDAGILWAARQLLPAAPGRRFLTCVLVALGALMLFSVVGVDLLHSVLATQVQLWRVLWLAHLLAVALVPFVVWNFWCQGGTWRLVAGLVAVAVLSAHCKQDSTWAVLLGWAVCQGAAAKGLHLSSSIGKAGLGVCALLLLAMSATQLSVEYQRLQWHPPVSVALALCSLAVTAPLVSFLILGVVAWLMARNAVVARGLAIGALLALGLALTGWDRRDELALWTESEPKAHVFKDVIPPDATVYWPDELATVWAALERVSHYSRQQRAGLLFNRATAEIIGARVEAYRLIEMDRASCESGAAIAGKRETLLACATPRPERLQSLCSGSVKPDFLVFPTRLQPAPIAEWPLARAHFYLYACKQLAPGATHANPA